MDTTNIVFAVIAGLAVIVGLFIERRGSAADLVNAATGLVEPLQERITHLESRVHDLERKATALELWGKALAEQVRQLGGVPIPFEEFLGAVVKANHDG